MLSHLSIRNIVLIEKLDLEMSKGLGVLTGETGAGKSILLDSLGLVTGARADSRLVREGTEQATVTAAFDLPVDHPACRLASEQDVDVEGELILRRTLTKDGRSKAFINDQPVSVSLLRSIGEQLVEIHGQHDERGLLNAAQHRSLLDAFGQLSSLLDKTTRSWREKEAAREKLERARIELEAARQDEDYLRHVVQELDLLAPQEGEEEALASDRTLLMNAEKISSEVKDAADMLANRGGVDAIINGALRKLERVADKAEGHLDEVIEGLDRAVTETMEARNALARAMNEIGGDPERLEEAEERLFALRAAARKHNVTVDDLPQLLLDLQEKLQALENTDAHLKQLEVTAGETEKAYVKAANELSAARQKAASKLDKLVNDELPPLKLEAARFSTQVDTDMDLFAGPEGADRVEFQIATNKGSRPGPLIKIASGGELARIILALKVVLARQGSAPTLIFDEVDRGVGGAVADAVGERLARLSDDSQVLVVTHSPQVAARGSRHLHISKASSNAKDAPVTSVKPLEKDGRREEVARMLAGAQVTEEARAAADRLLERV